MSQFSGLSNNPYGQISYFLTHIYDEELQTISYYFEYNYKAIIIDPVIGHYEKFMQIIKERNSKLIYVILTHLSCNAVMGHMNYLKNKNVSLIVSKDHQY